MQITFQSNAHGVTPQFGGPKADDWQQKMDGRLRMAYNQFLKSGKDNEIEVFMRTKPAQDVTQKLVGNGFKVNSSVYSQTRNNMAVTGSVPMSRLEALLKLPEVLFVIRYPEACF